MGPIATPRFSDYGPKIVCVLTRNPAYDHYFLSKDLFGPPSLKSKCQTLLVIFIPGKMSFWNFRHKHMTTGKVPPGTSGASAVVLENHMYIIGGHIELGNTNDVYRLNLQTWTWELLECEGLKMSPRDKFSAWEYKNK